MKNWNKMSILDGTNWIRRLSFIVVFSVGIFSILATDIEDNSDPDPSEAIDVAWIFDDVLGRSSPAIGGDNTIYVGGGFGGNLYAINSDGSLKWLFPIDNQVNSSPTIGTDGTIYVGSLDRNLYAVNPDGSLKWNFSTGREVNSSVAIGIDGTIYAGSGSNLYAINPDSTQKWVSPVVGTIGESSPAIGCDGTIYVGTDQNLFAINPDGTQKWASSTDSPLYMYSPMIGSDGTVYIASFAINPDNGKIKWQHTFFDGVAIGSDGTIFGGKNHRIAALSPEGTLLWGYEADHEMGSVAIGSDGIIYGLGSFDQSLYAVNSDGTLNQKFQLFSRGERTSALTIGKGMLYMSGTALAAVQIPSIGLADSPWPMFQHDTQHTGRQSEVEKPVNVITRAEDNAVEISWQSVPGVASNIYWSTNPGVSTSDNKIASVTSPYIHTGLTNGVTYYYAVNTENNCGESILSDEVSATPVLLPPDAPTGLQAVSGNSEVSLSWNSSARATSYEVYRNETGGVSSGDALVYSDSDTQYTDTGLVAGTTYYYAVIASNVSGNSDLSSEVSATPQSGVPYFVSIAPGDGSLVNLCPDTTVFTAVVSGGDTPYSYNWIVTKTFGAGFDIFGSVDGPSLEVCLWDSMTELIIDVVVTDNLGSQTTDSINVGGL